MPVLYRFSGEADTRFVVSLETPADGFIRQRSAPS
jgi:hypothetical protein